ncbi:MAG: DNA-binding protein [Clostridia bacterium]|nr:DNA-binding protein [Clostridia bacterium]
MEEAVKYSILLELYGGILTEKQYELLDNYYNQDLGLSEIAENLGITRQAVRDNLKKGENNLIEFESKLHLMQKINQIDELKIDKKIKEEIRKILI